MARQRSDSPLLFDLPVRPDFRMERAAMREGVWPVCGTDEAGRGPLAGPVVAAAVILDPKRIPKGLDDSKRMSHAEREAVFDEILDKASAVSIASACAHSIDRSDIRKASLEAMCRAVKLLCIEPKLVLADGRDIPPGLTCDGKAVVKGDQRSQSIAAASIIAKVTRDRMMTRTASIHVSYGFDLHMGYATARHRTAIEAHGPLTRLHRLSFAPFRLDAAE
ncbi:ribonuclease HII [Aliihoeflea aestuarii]|jgi:ribonuclease HII|uniref:ribonuclease HII n=1 Tax=Aliihoeflea aestuarii TaxID=453840 RepID=UPI0020963B14|nr:ribonuclease HII [Aliihoeflea aestuarii]MCO6392059.1 ribonuclease HII [Aliihoeflea aestuarii]